MRSDEIRELKGDEIAARIAELREERFRLEFRSATEPLEEPLRLRSIRRDIARLHTIRREQELGIVRAASAPAERGTKGRKKKTARRPAKKGASKTRAR